MEICFFNKNDLSKNIDNFCNLYNSCFNDKMDAEILTHRFIKNLSDDILMCVALDKGKIVANYSAIPSLIYYNNKLIKSAIAINTMTHPDYEGKGLFVKLSSSLFDKMKAEDYKFIYSFPNYLSNKILVSNLGWKDIYEFPTLEYSVNPEQKELTTVFNECEFEDIVPLNDEKHIHLYKDSDYIKWRYKDIPNKKYFCIMADDKNYAIYKFYEDEINIVEIGLTSDELAFDLIAFFKNLAVSKKMNKITTWAHLNTPLHYAFEKAGFINRYPIRYFAALSLNETDFDIFDHRNWSICMGDDNVY